MFVFVGDVLGYFWFSVSWWEGLVEMDTRGRIWRGEGRCGLGYLREVEVFRIKVVFEMEKI